MQHCFNLRLSFIVISIIAGLNSCSTVAPEGSRSGRSGWDRVQWGDSRRTVASQYPEATTKFTSTGTNPLIAPRVDIGESFNPKAVFHFNNDKLWSVFLTHSADTGFKHWQSYEKLKKYFTKKHGSPLINDRWTWTNERKTIARRESSWESDDLKILLSQTGVNDLESLSLFVLVYSSPTQKASL